MAVRTLPAAIRSLQPRDREEVARIDERITGVRKAGYWDRILREFLDPPKAERTIGLAAEDAGGLVGYLLGEVRAFEFGSEPCGWIFAVGVAPEWLRRGVASGLLEEACARFRTAGVTRVRTMVRRNDVPVLAFFRSNGFVGGRFVQLETELDPGSGAETPRAREGRRGEET